MSQEPTPTYDSENKGSYEYNPGSSNGSNAYGQTAQNGSYDNQGAPQYNNQYGASQYNAGQSPMMYQNSPQQVEANKASQMSMIMGILGLFILPIVFGPIAIVQAKKAERLGAAATVGKVLGWIDTILGVIGLIVIIFFIVTVVASGGAASMN